MDPTYFIKPEKIVGLYMTTSNKTKVTYEELTAYTSYITGRYNTEHKQSKIVPLLSDKYLHESEHDYGHLLEYKKNCIKIKTHIDLKLIAKEIVAWISWCVIEPCTIYSKEFFDKQRQKVKIEKENEKKL